MPLDLIIPAAIALLTGAGILGYNFATSGSRAAAKRLKAVAAPKAKLKQAKTAPDASGQRRRQVQETLQELERKQSENAARKKLSIRAQLDQAGLDAVSVRTFWMASAGVGAAAFALLALFGVSPVIAALIGFAAGFGVPRWTISFLIGKRLKAFTNEFANAVDVIVRGVRSGLPVNECLKVVGNESAEPVGPEFRSIVEASRIGMTLEDSLARMYQSVPTPEVNFFQIVMVVQQKTGGNLSEALANLSNVLRDRKKMKAKIQAMSSEAKASALIIGSLPFVVMMAVWVINPGYLEIMFETRAGNLMLGGCLFWMFIGVQVMRKMIDFRF